MYFKVHLNNLIDYIVSIKKIIGRTHFKKDSKIINIKLKNINVLDVNLSNEKKIYIIKQGYIQTEKHFNNHK